MLALTVYDDGPKLTFTIDPDLLARHKGPLVFEVGAGAFRVQEEGAVRSARMYISAPPIVRVYRDPEAERLFLSQKRREHFAKKQLALSAAVAAGPSTPTPPVGKEQS